MLEGVSFTLNCTALRIPMELLPLSRLTWLAPDQEQVADIYNATFLILAFDSVQVQESGAYTCHLMIQSDLLEGGGMTGNSIFDLQVEGEELASCLLLD